MDKDKKLMKVLMYPCDRTILVVFMAGRHILFKFRLTRQGAQDVSARLSALLSGFPQPHHTYGQNQG
jgi:hypothetical protein